MDSKKNTVVVKNAPECCTSKEIKQQIGAYLTNGENAVIKVKQFNTSTGEVIPGKFEVELMLFEGKNKKLFIDTEILVINLNYPYRFHTKGF